MQGGDDDAPVLVTSAEAAVLARVEPATIRAWKHRGRLPVAEIGPRGESLFALADVFAMTRGTDPRTHRRHAET